MKETKSLDKLNTLEWYRVLLRNVCRVLIPTLREFSNHRMIDPDTWYSLGRQAGTFARLIQELECETEKDISSAEL